GFSSRLWMNTSLPSRKMSARKPSHLGSKIHAPALGSSLTRFASIGRIGGLTGSSIICVFVPQITRIDRDVASPRKRSGRYRFRELFVAPSPRPHSETEIPNLRSQNPPSPQKPPSGATASADSHLAPHQATQASSLINVLAERSTMHSPHNE